MDLARSLFVDEHSAALFQKFFLQLSFAFAAADALPERR